MGTSGAYGGSSGRAWSRARRRARNLPDHPTDRDIERVLNAVGDGLGLTGEAPEGPEAGPTTPATDLQTDAPAGPPVSWGPISARRAAGGGAGGAGGTGGAGGGRRGRTNQGGGWGRRSVARAARAAGRAGRVAYALAARDGATLAALGLSFADLEGLSPAEQAQRIAADVIVAATIEEAEIHRAIDETVIEVLDGGGDMPPAEFARLFVANLVIEIVKTELMGVLNDGSRPADWVGDVQRRMEDFVRAAVDSLTIDDGGTADIEALINEVLPRTQEVLASERRAA